MKIKYLVLFSILISIIEFRASAYDFSLGGIYYIIDTDSTVSVSYTFQGNFSSWEKKNEYYGRVIIPPTVSYGKTYTVTSIGNYAFCGCSGLTSIDIPESVTSIGDHAFDGCSGLTSVTISEGLTSIGNYAFDDCSGLTSINIPESVTSIGNNAFSACSNLTFITIPESVTSIGHNAFSSTQWYNNKPDGLVYAGKVTYKYKGTMPKGTIIDIQEGTKGIGSYTFDGCSGLKSINIPESVTSLGNNAFYDCSGLTSITISEGLTSIGYRAFYGCSGLTSITIPNSVTSIGGYAFEGCSNLKKVIIPNITSWLSLSFGNLESNPLSYAKHIYSDEDKEVKCLIIPDSVTGICDYAFYGCEFYSVIIGSGVLSIGKTAFSQTPIKTIWLTNTPPENYVIAEGSINYVANNQYTLLNNRTIYPFLSSIFDVDGIRYVPISPSERTCDAIDCLYDESVSNIYIAKTVSYKDIAMTIKEVKPYTCYNNPYIEDVQLDFGGTVGSYAFSGCKNLLKVTLNNKGDVNNSAFSYCTSLMEVSVTNEGNIRDYAFFNSNIHGTLTIGNMGNVGSSAFSAIGGKYNAFVNNTGFIGQSAFRNSSGLLTLEIENNVSTIGERAFSNCVNLNSAKLNNRGAIQKSAFQACKNLNTADLGDSITSIGEYVFSECAQLNNVIIPDSVVSLGSFSFSNCLKLQSANIGNGVVSIPNDCFAGCSSLSNVVIGSSVKSIGTAAFSGCSTLPNLSIPYEVVEISNYAFSGCSALKTIILEQQDVRENAFELKLGCNGGSPLFVDCPLDSLFIGRNISYSTNSSEGYSPFYRNTSLRSVTITDKETEISHNEFYGCTNLKKVRIGDGVTTIGDWAFSGCSSLDYFAFGSRLKSIGKEAFSDCNTVTQIISRASTPPTCGSQALDDINKWKCKLTVPMGNLVAYQTAEQWKDFFFMEEVDMGFNHILSYMVDGVEYRTYNIDYGTSIIPEEEPSKEGYTFSGWSEIPDEMPNYDVTITGSFTINQYTVKFIVDGDVVSEQMLDYGTAIIAPEITEKEGYTFSGWDEIPETVPAQDVIVTGSFTVNSYTLLYMVDGEEYKKATVDYGTELIAEATPEKEGYTFSGWSELPDTMPAHDVTVTGSFTINKYKLTYIVDGAEYKSFEINYATAITPETEPTKEGYTFSGWSEVPETMPAHDVSVMGSYSVNSYTLVYIVDGVEYKKTTVDYGTILIAEATPEKEGYTFSGWSEIPATMPAHDVTVTGSYSVNSYTLIYMVDGVEYKKTTVDYGTELIAEAAPEKEGYTFSGWSEIPETMPAHNVTVTGSFTVNKYKVRYYDGDKLIAEDEVEYGAEVVLRDYTPEDTSRYTFIGWDGEKYETMPAHDIEYHANIADGVSQLAGIPDGVEAIYDANGRKLSKMQRGVNILLMSDGTKRKIIVK